VTRALEFSQDWFSRSIPAWKVILTKLAEQNTPLRILEIGVFEGRSTCWLLENFCKSPESSIVAIDTFQGGMEHRQMELGDLRKRFEGNISVIGSTAQVEIMDGTSFQKLCELVGRKSIFDFISVDGSHHAADVLADAVLAFQLLRSGGVMAFDDYLWAPVRRGAENPLVTPKAAVDAFTNIYSQQMRVIPNLPLYQLYIQKY